MLRAAGLAATAGLKLTLSQSSGFAPSLFLPALTTAVKQLPDPNSHQQAGKWLTSRLMASVSGQMSEAAQPHPVSNLQEEYKLGAKLEADQTVTPGFVAPHPGLQKDAAVADYLLMHPVYTPEYVESVQPKHLPVKKAHQYVGFYAIQAVRRIFDLATGYGPNMNEKQWLRRMIFLETVAGVPGMAAGVLRHLESLRSMKRDNGWIHTLLEEAENERMHLLTFLQLRQPNMAFRFMVLLAQGVFFNFYFVAYLLHPPTCHSLVGYLEEEAVKTYTHCLKDISEGNMKHWQTQAAPPIAIDYWKLPKTATMRDVILAVRADEACHSHVNHAFSMLKKTDPNPFTSGNHQVP